MVPITLSNDRQALEAAFRSIGLWSTGDVRMAWITNTADLKRLAVSPALTKEAKLKGLSICEQPFALPFDANGNLPRLLNALSQAEPGTQKPRTLNPKHGSQAHKKSIDRSQGVRNPL